MKLRIRSARSFWQRAIGLLGRAALDLDEALLIRPCQAIHTCGMRFAIDVVFLDRNGVVLSVHPAVGPWRVRRQAGAHAVLELAEGAALRYGIRAAQSRGAWLDAEQGSNAP
ncbi:MAG TPA: DUF192 domain-containing protein [Thauera sp.]|jgi:uncharacterized membrane protein (UPF0127 family)|nr:DUF192 domain-containing protein [Thauera sp.]HRA80780.1 DUF192 domain-containing protein [Thauera sp.]